MQRVRAIVEVRRVESNIVFTVKDLSHGLDKKLIRMRRAEISRDDWTCGYEGITRPPHQAKSIVRLAAMVRILDADHIDIVAHVAVLIAGPAEHVAIKRVNRA